jgi:hypothetical protein
MGETEANLAPVVIRVAEKECFDSTESVALRLLAATLHSRTRKAVEIAKVVPKRIAYEVIKNAIERGKLPAPEGGWELGVSATRITKSLSHSTVSTGSCHSETATPVENSTSD